MGRGALLGGTASHACTGGDTQPFAGVQFSAVPRERGPETTFGAGDGVPPGVGSQCWGYPSRAWQAAVPSSSPVSTPGEDFLLFCKQGAGCMVRVGTWKTCRWSAFQTPGQRGSLRLEEGVNFWAVAAPECT